jgi:hypothetical protein
MQYNIIAIGLSVVLVLCITLLSAQTGSTYITWAYVIGDEPFGRMVFLICVALIASYYSFPVALMLVVLYMLINSLVPVLSDMDESFIDIANEVFGPTLTNCSNYEKDVIARVGTPFSPTFKNETHRTDRATY